jgi:hypothetical protein
VAAPDIDKSSSVPLDRTVCIADKELAGREGAGRRRRSALLRGQWETETAWLAVKKLAGRALTYEPCGRACEAWAAWTRADQVRTEQSPFVMRALMEFAQGHQDEAAKLIELHGGHHNRKDRSWARPSDADGDRQTATS